MIAIGEGKTYLDGRCRRELETYIRRLRNNTKRAYAGYWLAFRRSGSAGHYPHELGLAAMASQGVRMHIDSILRDHGFDWLYAADN